MPRNSNGPDKKKGIADIVFLVDATGSMSSCIDGLKANLDNFFTTLANADANSGFAIADWRARIVGFRDIEADGSQWLEANTFVRDVDQLRSQLNNLVANGGGDDPESLLDALFFLSQIGETDHDSEDPNKWRRPSDAQRTIAVFTDAQFKEVMSISGAEGGTVNDVINQINSNKLKLFIFAPDDPGYDVLSSASFVEYTPIGGEGLDEVTSDASVFEKLLLQLAKSISVSASTPIL